MMVRQRRGTPFAFFALALSAALAAACGKVSDSPGADAASDGGGDDDDGGAIDAAGDTDAAAADDKRGLIFVFSRNYTDGEGTLVLSASAQAAFGDHDEVDCAVELEETDCRELACTGRTPSRPAPGAGDVTIEGLTRVVLTADADGVYAPFELTDALLFNDGGDLSVSAAGADVPAFEFALVAPYSIGFTDGGPPAEIRAAAGLDLSWNVIEPNDRVKISLSSIENGEGVTHVVACDVAAGKTSTTLSPAALALLPPGDLLFAPRIESSRTATAGDYAVTMTAAVVMRTGGDASFDNAERVLTLVP